MPPLSNLTLEQLQQLTQDLAEIEDAGRLLHAAGLEPVFDLTPGAQMRITTSAVMPEANDHGFPVTVVPQVNLTRHHGEIDWGNLDRIAEQVDRELAVHFGETEPDSIPNFLKHGSTEAAPMPPAPAPVDAPLAPGEVAGGAAISAEPSRTDEDAGTPKVAAEPEAKAESGGGAGMAAPHTPAAPALPQPWSVEEDQTLLNTVVDLMVNAGLARKPAATEAAKLLPGRTADACIYRAHTKWKAVISNRVAEAAFKQAQTEAPEIPESEAEGKAVVSGDSAAGGHSPAAVPETTPEALGAAFDRQVDAMPDLHGEDLRVWQWVAAHRAKWPHTAGTDLDLAVGLGRGEKIGMIALDLGIDVKHLQGRWDCLSRPIQNAQGKITIDGMPRLINILRRIAKAPAAAA